MARTIDITDRATPLLQGIGRAIADGSLENAMGRGATNEIQQHLFALNESRPNRLGGKRTHFYSSAAKGTSYTAQPGLITVTVRHVGFRQRLEGGTIRPTGGRKFLTIPARAEAHGRRASEFNDLVMIFNRARQPIGLAQANQTQVKIGRPRKDGTRKVSNKGEIGGLVMFWLTKSVTQRPDPSVLPTDQQIADAAIAGGNAYLDALKARGGAK